jgi:uncharacterized protein with PQ loop repeat
MVIGADMTTWLTSLYGVAGVVTIAFFVPQIQAVTRSETGARDVSLLMWGAWSAAAAIAVLYAHFVVHDPGYLLVSLGNATGCFLVTGLTAFKRLRERGHRTRWFA